MDLPDISTKFSIKNRITGFAEILGQSIYVLSLI